MSFWAGLARGFADADAKKEREAVRAEAEAARTEARDYTRGRDKIMDERYSTQQETAAALAAEEKDRLERKLKQSAEQLKSDREWRALEAKQKQDNLDRAYVRAGEYAERDWALKIDQFNYTQDQSEEAKKQFDLTFQQRVDQFEYGKSRDVVGDLRADREEVRAIARELYQKERDLINDDQALNNYNLRMRQFEHQVKREGVSDEQWQKSFELQQDAQTFNQTMQVWKALPEGMAQLLGGGDSSSPGKVGVISQEAMELATPEYSLLVADLSKEEKDSDFFKALGKSPGGQATVVGFMEAQADKGNTIALKDVPKYFRYLGVVEGKGQEEAEEFLDLLTSGEAIKDLPALVKGLNAAKNLRQTQHIFMKVDVPADIRKASVQVEFWEKAVEADAWDRLNDLAPEDNKKVDRALAFLRSPETRGEGLSILAKYGFGQTAVKDLGMEGNSIIQMHYGTNKGTVPGVGASVGSGAGNTPGGNQNVPVVVSGTEVTQAQMDAATVFQSWEAVTEARGKGFYGLASVGGEVRSVPPLETGAEGGTGGPEGGTGGPEGGTGGPEGGTGGPEGGTGGPEGGTGGKVSDSAFHGSGYIDLKAPTAIDAMFNKASNLEDSAVEPTIIKRTPKVEEIPDVNIEEGVENLSAIPDTFESPEELEKGVSLALEEIEELGIVFPTTNTELVEFQADINELVGDMGADIPKPVLEEVIRLAVENAKGGLSATGTLMEAHETGLGQGGDPTDTPVGTQLKELSESMGITTSNLKKLLQRNFGLVGAASFEAALKAHLEKDGAELPSKLSEFKAFTDRIGVTEPDIKKRKRKPEPEPELNRSEISRLQRAVESGNTELVNKLVKKYGEDKIEETMKKMGL